jgi:hypothetical protein
MPAAQDELRLIHRRCQIVHPGSNYVRLPPRCHHTCCFDRGLFFAVMVAIVSGVAGPGQIWASSLSAVTNGNVTAENHRHSCRCAECQGDGSCCCSKTQRTQQAVFSPSDPVPTQSNGGPCVKARACGNAGLPVAGAPVVVGALALSSARTPIDHADRCRWLCPVSNVCVPPRGLSRLDDPPEGARRVNL